MRWTQRGVFLVDIKSGSEALWRIPHPGARPVTLATPEAETTLRVLDGAAYWVDWVSSADAVTFDGSAPSEYPTDDVLMGLGLDGGMLFVVDLGPEGAACQLRSMPVTGGAPTLLYDGRLSSEGRCELMHFSAQRGRVFWMDTSSGEGLTLKTIPASGGTAVSLLSGIATWGGNFASDEQNVYFGAELDDGRSGVIRVTSTGGEPTILYSTEQGLVATDGVRIYFAVNQGDQAAAVLSVPK